MNNEKHLEIKLTPKMASASRLWRAVTLVI